MQELLARLTHLLRDTSGQDIVEYALILTFVSLACIASIDSLGNSIAQVPNELWAQFFNLMS